MKNKFLLIACLSIFVLACTGEPDFSFTPEIGFNSIQVFFPQSLGKLGVPEKRDSVVITIDFKDGDGDLGTNLTQKELTELALKNDPKLKNFIVDTYVSKNGKFIKSDFADPNGGFLPFKLKNGSKNGPIEGTIDYSIIFTYGLIQDGTPFTGKRDTVKFAVTIKDRANNLSNTVETTPIVVYTK